MRNVKFVNHFIITPYLNFFLPQSCCYLYRLCHSSNDYACLQTLREICSSLSKNAVISTFKDEKTTTYITFINSVHTIISSPIGTVLISQTSAEIYFCMTTKGRSQSVVLDDEQSGALPVRLPSTVWCVTGLHTWALLVPYVHKWHAWLNQNVIRLFADDIIKYLAITNYSDCQSIQGDLS